MNPKHITDLSKLCLHTITTKPWNIGLAAENYAAHGVKGITVWRDALNNRHIGRTGIMLRNHGLEIVSLCRGGFFPNINPEKRKQAIADNLKAIDEAQELGTKMIVLVCGADPAQSLEDSRKQIADGISEILPVASAAGIKLAIEPLHPMYADTRSAINTLKQANDLVQKLQSPWLGVAVDVYHVWWDPDLENEIRRCGENNALFAFHICDWKSPATDFLNDRGLMGEGCIPIKKIRSWVEAAGFDGFNEVEIFSNEYWKQDQSEFLNRVINAYRNNS